MLIVDAVIASLLVVNVWTITCYWRDKNAAIAGRRRIPEADLLGLAIIGGTPGAFLARHMFRHKTRKQPFSTYLYLIAVIQIGLAMGLLVPADW